MQCVPIRAFQRVLTSTDFNGIGTRRCVPIREVSSFQKGVRELGPEDASL